MGSATLFSQNFAPRDLLGRIATKTETVQGSTHAYAYGYDARGRLTDVRIDGSPSSHYEYDPNGNRLLKNTEALTALGTYDNQDRLLMYGLATYAYGPDGELTAKTTPNGVTLYTYDVLGNLIQVRLPGITIDYVVDGRHHRVGKKVNGVVSRGYLWDSKLRIVAELDGTGAVVSRFVYGIGANVPDYMTKGTNIYRLLRDQVGSVRLVIDAATGALAQRMDFDEFGNVVSDTAPGFQPFGFAGGLYDEDTKLVRFGARDYDADTGRWIAKDPVRFSGGLNFYVYIGNDPLRLTDPTGLDAGGAGQYDYYCHDQCIDAVEYVADLCLEDCKKAELPRTPSFCSSEDSINAAQDQFTRQCNQLCADWKKLERNRCGALPYCGPLFDRNRDFDPECGVTLDCVFL